MFLDEILAFEMRDARLLVGIGNRRIDQMPDTGRLRSFRGNDSLTGLFLGPGVVAVALSETWCRRHLLPSEPTLRHRDRQSRDQRLPTSAAAQRRYPACGSAP